jgi:hypothetical protein
MTDDLNPLARPGNHDPAIDQATDNVVETWKQSGDDKDPTATTGDFERMRDGFGELADDAPTGAIPPAVTPDVRGRHA